VLARQTVLCSHFWRQISDPLHCLLVANSPLRLGTLARKSLVS